MSKMKTLEDFFMDELKDVYSAEKQITKALPKMAKTASAEELRSAFENHLKETEGQIDRLDKIGKILGKNLAGKKCKAMEGLMEEGKELMEEEAEPEVMDAALIAAAQKVEHYEMATYGCLKTYARLLGYDEVGDLLQETLDEEGNADKVLTEIAEQINIEAVEPAETE